MGIRTTIVIVDDSIANLKAGKSALSANYDVITVPSAERLFEYLKLNTPQLILLDVNMPDMDGFETIKILKSNSETEFIPVIFLTGKNDSDSEIEGLNLGAVDYISKPFLPELLNKRVDVHVIIEKQKRLLQQYSDELLSFNETLQKRIDEKTRNMKDLQTVLLQTISDLVERRDGNTGGHIARTQRYLKLMITALMEQEKYGTYIQENWDVDLLVLSSRLHDVGKIAISDNILLKPGKLTEDEFTEMKKHVLFGKEIIDHIIEMSVATNFLEYAKTLVETHHEKWDGEGYPYGLKGEAIPLSGRLMAIADVYDALVSERHYKSAFSHEEAVQIIVA
ncbi:MAG: response regulator, partial [Oscillospiraceae bacterium]|nr:response regulator [Oscillospiraceae bacterium]